MDMIDLQNAIILIFQEFKYINIILDMVVFTVVNLSLIALKCRSSGPVGGPVCGPVGGGGDHFSVPLIVPVLGVTTSLALLATSVL